MQRPSYRFVTPRKGTWAGLSLLVGACLFATSPAGAQPRGPEGHEAHEAHPGHEAAPHGHPEPGRFQTPHWTYDERFHHDRFYPAPGYAVGGLPPGHVAVPFRGERYFFHGGVWYRQFGPNFTVIVPPIGIVLPMLPPSYVTVWAAGVPYYYANDVYYTQVPGGYEVVAPPTGLTTSPPPGPAPQGAGSWYYCESARAYYPYVSQCPEGWRAVPAQPR
jgi:Family of unknown function (DUF6515)